MIARSWAERLIRDALSEVRYMSPNLDHLAARLIDEIYGVDGADAINPRYGTRLYREYEAD